MAACSANSIVEVVWIVPISMPSFCQNSLCFSEDEVVGKHHRIFCEPAGR